MASKYWYGGADSLVLGDYSWDTSRFQKNLDNAAAVDKGGGKVGIPCTGHNFPIGSSITIAGSTNYNDTYEVDADTTTDEIVITETYAAENFAGTETATSSITASNWRLCADDSETTKPTSSDKVYVDNRAYYNDSLSRYQDMNVNVSGAFTGYPCVPKFHVSKSYGKGIIGSPSEYLEIEANSADIIYEASGTMYLKLSAGTGTDAGCGRLIVNNSKANVHIASLENDVSNVGLYDKAICIQGNLVIDDNTAVAYIESVNSNATITIGTGCYDNKNSLATVFRQVEGQIISDSPIGDSLFIAGTFYWGTELAAAEAGLDCGEITVYPNHQFIWSCMDPDTSILKKFTCYGNIDASRSTNASYAKQIGTGAGEDSEIWSGNVKLNSGTQNITLGSGSVIKPYGGTLNTPAAIDISW